MAEYTYKDVIIDPEDPRVEIGKKYYWADIAYDVLKMANKDGGTGTLEKVSHDSDLPFVIKTDCSCACLIRKKEPEKQYVPFDLTKEEDRNFLKGRWIKTDGDEEKITGFERDDDGVWHIKISADYLLPEDMLNLWRFEDNTLCGKLVEETE